MKTAQQGTLDTSDETIAQQTISARSTFSMLLPKVRSIAARILLESGTLIRAAAMPKEARVKNTTGFE
jgi:hypothetical protein